MLTLFVFLWFGATFVSSQTPGHEKRLPRLVRGKVVDGDTVPYVFLPEVVVSGRWTKKNKRERAKYDRLVYNVKKTLPYARIAGKRINDINTHLAALQTEKQRKEYLKQAEKELFDEFEAPLKKLSFSQGKLLIRLIDRETGNSSFSLIKDYKGGVSAFFWQSVARVFGANLKDEYEIEGDDKVIEHIIKQIDSGVL